MVGPWARHAETLPDQVVLDGCMELIRRFLGSTYAVVDCTNMKRLFCADAKSLEISFLVLQIPVVFQSTFSGQLFVQEHADGGAQNWGEPTCHSSNRLAGRPGKIFFIYFLC